MASIKDFATATIVETDKLSYLTKCVTIDCATQFKQAIGWLIDMRRHGVELKELKHLSCKSTYKINDIIRKIKFGACNYPYMPSSRERMGLARSMRNLKDLFVSVKLETF